MKRQLWIRLKHYHFDHLVPPHLTDHVAAAFGGADASTKAFAHKLARKLGWSTGFALRAIDEYKKFVYLGIVADFPVTPPKVIDQVWHEHLLFSRPYRDFCRDVLERDFDHHPELVSTDKQTDSFESGYAATLELYETEFGVQPPVEFWGVPKFGTRSAALRDRQAKPKRATATTGYSDSTPLYMLVGDSDYDSCRNTSSHWMSDDSASTHHASHSASDTSSSSGGSCAAGGGSCSSGTCSSGSGCSSSCGGGGGCSS